MLAFSLNLKALAEVWGRTKMLPEGYQIFQTDVRSDRIQVGLDERVSLGSLTQRALSDFSEGERLTPDSHPALRWAREVFLGS